jgi:hypothetical protein
MTRPALLVLGLLACTSAFAQAPSSASDIAMRLLDRLDAHDYTAAESAFGERMAAAVPADKLAAVWESLPVQAGAARGRGTPTVSTGDGVQTVVVPLHEPCVGVADTKFTPIGKLSVATTFVAGDGPLLVTIKR